MESKQIDRFEILGRTLVAPLVFKAPVKRRKSRVCLLDSCVSRHYAKGFCKKHYTQVLRHGRLTPERERGVVRVCKAVGCVETDTIRFYCRKHARQIRVHGRLTPEREHNMDNEGCSMPGCDESHRAKSLCARHYNQARWRRIKAQRARQRARETAKFSFRSIGVA
jgi:hypothetical protein